MQQSTMNTTDKPFTSPLHQYPLIHFMKEKKKKKKKKKLNTPNILYLPRDALFLFAILALFRTPAGISPALLFFRGVRGTLRVFFAGRTGAGTGIGETTWGCGGGAGDSGAFSRRIAPG